MCTPRRARFASARAKRRAFVVGALLAILLYLAFTASVRSLQPPSPTPPVEPSPRPSLTASTPSTSAPRQPSSTLSADILLTMAELLAENERGGW